MIEKNTLAYFGKDKASMKPIGPAHNFKTAKKKVALLWGDPMYVISVAGGRARVSAKGHHFDLVVDDLMPEALLSVFQIDVGQGDSAIVHTPDDRWLMVDGGPAPQDSNSGKGAADFLSWKMFVDQSWKQEFNFRKGPLVLDGLICTHPDFDHYGGFFPLDKHLKRDTLRIGTVFHNGMGRFSGPFEKYRNGRGFSQLGPVEGGALPDAYLTTLLDDFESVRQFLEPTPHRPWKLHGRYRDWLEALVAHPPGQIGAMRRVDEGMRHLPGFAPNDPGASIRLLGPVVERQGNLEGLRYLDSSSRVNDPSLTRNGHSVVLRLDHGQARILLTGDLNFKSQAVLLNSVAKEEYKAHVAKGCHHGSDDVSTTFLAAIDPWATMISSGDNEGHVHPRAILMGLTGAVSQPQVKGTSKNRFLNLSEPRFEGPLIYSTEVSRSVRLREAHAAFDKTGKRVPKAQVQAKTAAGDAPGLTKDLKEWLLGDDLTYGLINVRTDGKKILIGVLKEDQAAFHVETLKL